LKSIAYGYTSIVYEYPGMSKPAMIESKARIACESDIEKMFHKKQEKKMLTRLTEGKICVVAEALGGFIWIDAQAGYLYDACVHPEHRRKGYYTSMLVTAIGYLSERGIHPVAITVDATNIASRRGVEKVGFRIKKTKHRQLTVKEVLHLLMISLHIPVFRRGFKEIFS
jgi:ribosomal protein S18 acetylase RimI-like enzyme